VTRVLVVDDDRDMARLLELHLSFDGFEVDVRADGAAALDRAATHPPDLVLLEATLPGMDGLEVCRRLRADPATASVPVIMLAATASTASTVAGLAAGADDYVVKPFPIAELLARVASTVRRSADMRSVSPLTGLAGNTRIQGEIATRFASGEPFAVCYCDLDGFKAFNDVYGFLRGDGVICLLADVLRRAATAAGEPPVFVGHVGGDDFIAVCAPGQVQGLCAAVMADLDAGVPALHDPPDVERGYLVTTDRRGNLVTTPLVSVSIGVALSDRRPFSDPREAVAVATEMKGVAKKTPGSAAAIDRRRDAG
jgi:PleD family two-component response regulator